VLHENKRRWLDVCAEAAICDDSERLNELACEINEILSEEEQGLEQCQAKPVCSCVSGVIDHSSNNNDRAADRRKTV
jgi:hypothetical protein